MSTKNLSAFVRAYLECALWSSTDSDGAPLDADHGIEDFAPEAVASAQADCDAFTTAQAADLALAGLSDDRAGHDFWLNRNGHGSGFWDEGQDPVFRRLSDACEPYGSSDCYVGDDGRIYLT